MLRLKLAPDDVRSFSQGTPAGQILFALRKLRITRQDPESRSRYWIWRKHRLEARDRELARLRNRPADSETQTSLLVLAVRTWVSVPTVFSEQEWEARLFTGYDEALAIWKWHIKPLVLYAETLEKGYRLKQVTRNILEAVHNPPQIQPGQGLPSLPPLESVSLPPLRQAALPPLRSARTYADSAAD